MLLYYQNQEGRILINLETCKQLLKFMINKKFRIRHSVDLQSKYKSSLDFKPKDTIQNFMKRIEKNEYYKEKVYDRDIYMYNKSI